MSAANKRRGASLKERLAARTMQQPNGCWEWQGHVMNNGYGQIGLGDGTPKIVLTHRASYMVHIGPIPDGMFVCHVCDNRRCINPAHLFLGTHADNMRDAKEKGRTRAPRGESAPNAKLTSAQVSEIRRRHRPNGHPARKLGTSTIELAREFGVCRQYIRDLVRGDWRAHDGEK